MTKHPTRLPYRSLAITTGTAVVLLAVMTVACLVLTVSVRRHTFDARTLEARAGIQKDLDFLHANAVELASSETLKQYIRTRDILNLASFAVAESRDRRLGGLLVADRSGVTLTRATAIQQRGDYIFNTTPWGALLGREQEVTVVERGIAHPIEALAGVPVSDADQLLGAVVVVFPMYDNYARQFAEAYLHEGDQVVFYQYEAGVTGSSLIDPDARRLIDVSFNSGSDWVRFGRRGAVIRIDNDAYFVENVVFSGVTDSPGGMILLYRMHYQQDIAIATAFAGLVLLAVLVRMVPRRYRWSWQLIVVVVIGGALFSLAGLVSQMFIRHGHEITILRPANAIYNSTISLSPENDIIDRGFERRIAIRVATGGEAINVAQAVIVFDPTIVTVSDIDTSKSLCSPSLFIEKSIDPTAGTVTISCGIPNPGFSGLTGTIAELVIQPLVMGTFTLHFAKDTHILANDGLGTDVLRMATDGSYTVTTAQAVADPLGRTPPVIFSSTHPNATRWYAKQTAHMTWQSQPGLTYAYSVDQHPIGSIRDAVPAADGVADVTAPHDGAYYFHLFVRSGTSLRSSNTFMFKVDTMPPYAPAVRLRDSDLAVGDVLQMEFDSSDVLSGLQKNFYVKIDDGIFIPISSPLLLPLTAAGDYLVTLRVFDNAGNTSQTTTNVHVEKR